MLTFFSAFYFRNCELLFSFEYHMLQQKENMPSIYHIYLNIRYILNQFYVINNSLRVSRLSNRIKKSLTID